MKTKKSVKANGKTPKVARQSMKAAKAASKKDKSAVWSMKSNGQVVKVATVVVNGAKAKEGGVYYDRNHATRDNRDECIKNLLGAKSKKLDFIRGRGGKGKYVAVLTTGEVLKFKRVGDSKPYRIMCA